MPVLSFVLYSACSSQYSLWTACILLEEAMRTHTLKAIWRTVLTMVSIGLGSSVVLAQQQPSIGQVTALQGQATVQHAGNTQAMPLRVESPAYREDIIQTLAASKIKLVLLDQYLRQLDRVDCMVHPP